MTTSHASHWTDRIPRRGGRAHLCRWITSAAAALLPAAAASAQNTLAIRQFTHVNPGLATNYDVTLPAPAGGNMYQALAETQRGGPGSWVAPAAVVAGFAGAGGVIATAPGFNTPQNSGIDVITRSLVKNTPLAATSVTFKNAAGTALTIDNTPRTRNRYKTDPLDDIGGSLEMNNDSASSINLSSVVVYRGISESLMASIENSFFAGSPIDMRSLFTNTTSLFPGATLVSSIPSTLTLSPGATSFAISPPLAEGEMLLVSGLSGSGQQFFGDAMGVPDPGVASLAFLGLSVAFRRRR